jgi:hypothetical protein
MNTLPIRYIPLSASNTYKMHSLRVMKDQKGKTMDPLDYSSNRLSTYRYYIAREYSFQNGSSSVIFQQIYSSYFLSPISGFTHP